MTVLNDITTNNAGMQSAELDPDDDDVIIRGKFKVPRGLLDMVEARFKRMQPYMIPGAYYSWWHLLGEDFLKNFDCPVPLIINCLKHFSEVENAPFKASSFDGHLLTVFQLRPQQVKG